MSSLRVRSYGCKAVWYVVATLTCTIGSASAFGQIATSTTVSFAPTPVYQGETPVATITVTANGESTPDGAVNCNIQARGHAAAYARTLQDGVASIPLTTVALDPVGNEYTLACTYSGSPTYAASAATPVPFQIINCSVWTVNGNGTVSRLNCTGTVLGTQGTPGASASAGGIAVDSTGNAWAVTNTADSLVFVIPGATATSTFTGGGLLQPSAIAIDGAGQVWIANGGNSVSSFSSNGTAQSSATGYGATAAAAPKQRVRHVAHLACVEPVRSRAVKTRAWTGRKQRSVLVTSMDLQARHATWESLDRAASPRAKLKDTVLESQA